MSPAVKIGLLPIILSSSVRATFGCIRSSAMGSAKDTDLLSRFDGMDTVESSFLDGSPGLLVLIESVVYPGFTELSSAESFFASKCFKYSFQTGVMRFIYGR